jgi:hypothetical protein
LIGLALFLTLLITYNRVIGPGTPEVQQNGGSSAKITSQPVWDVGNRRYARVEQALQYWGAQPGEIVMVNDAPGYFVAANRPAISIPYGDLQTVRIAAQRYGARFLLLEMAQLQGSDDPYDRPGDRPGLHYLGAVEGIQVYKFGGS